MKNKLITCEYVSFGHPDKVADQISDALLDKYLESDPNTRAGIETMVKDNVVVLGGEVKTTAEIDVERTVRSVFDNIGYPLSHKLSGKDIKIMNFIGEQSPEISKGVDRIDCDCIGAGDQGFMVGFASNETNVYLPLGMYIARRICEAVATCDRLGPDVKTQVTINYSEKRPKIVSIIVSTMHCPTLAIEEVREYIKKMITTNLCESGKVMDDEMFYTYIKDKNDITYHINVNGEWHIGGPISDCGVTGRKIVIDQYGGYANVGGGAFSGKDFTKVDRSAAYMCRYIAKNIVAAGLADEAKVELGYVIGEPNPCSIRIDLVNQKESPILDLGHQIEIYVKNNIDLSPKGIMDRFFPKGMRPVFYNTARNGHFGFNVNSGDWYPWEKVDFDDDLNEYINEVELKLLEF